MRIRLVSIPLAVGTTLVALGVWLALLVTCTGTYSLPPPSSCQPPPSYYVLPEELIVTGATGIAVGLAILVPTILRNRRQRVQGSIV